MARRARFVVPHLPHHAVQRGVRGLDIFIDDEDRHKYLEIIGKLSRKNHVTVQAWCLMSNHVHLIVTPQQATGLSKLFRDGNGLYARYFNKRHSQKGALWQSRFYSCVMDSAHYFNGIRYVLRNPVEAKLVSTSTDWTWSSARYQFGLVSSDPLISEPYCTKTIAALKALAALDLASEDQRLKRCLNRGTPYASREFIQEMEDKHQINLLPRKPGPKIRDSEE